MEIWVDIARVLYMNGYSIYSINEFFHEYYGMNLTLRSLKDALDLRTYQDLSPPVGYIEYLASPGGIEHVEPPTMDEVKQLVHSLYISEPPKSPSWHIYSRRSNIFDLSETPDSVRVADKMLSNSTNELIDGTNSGSGYNITVWNCKNGRDGVHNYLNHERRSNAEYERLPEW